MLRDSYRQADIEALMMEADWTVIPSIWWENSPVVIQEAIFYCRPVLGSDIGGTAEKIAGRGGITFAARGECSLASLMERCINNPALHQGLLGQMEEPTTAALVLNEHVAIYKALGACCT